RPARSPRRQHRRIGGGRGHLTHHRPRFSGAFPDAYTLNPLSRERAALARSAELLDLTAANPTEVALTWPDLGSRLAACDGVSSYDPSPGGRPQARAAVEAYYRDRGVAAPSHRIVLTASTSEAYSWLFTLLAESGDRVALPTPGYPLCADLARLARWRVSSYRLQETPQGWRPNHEDIERALAAGARAVVAIHPHNPTGAFLTGEDQRWLQTACAEAGAALIVDEVFADFPWHAGAPPPEFRYQDSAALLFVLGGISKALALPQLKCSWIATFGPGDLATRAVAHLEYVADTYLSVATPTQLLLPELLAERAHIQEQVRTRLTANSDALARAWPQLSTPRGCGGWWRLCPLPSTVDDEGFALTLLRERHTLVHPGYLFDADQPAVALSLITPEDTFKAGVSRLVAAAQAARDAQGAQAAGRQ
ncbi:MAG: aminotransferase, partial [Dehalococcoidia bacterium]|nr:aminotransferase [Dehalococcoidia bacterium]